MERLPSGIRTSSAEFQVNHSRLTALVAELQTRHALVREGGGARATERQRELGKMPVRERIERLLDPGSPFLELSTLAAWEMYEGGAPSAGGADGGTGHTSTLHAASSRCILPSSPAPLHSPRLRP